MTPVDEPLELSAPLAWRLAPQLCRNDPSTGASCAWSHGIWQYLRLLGLIGSMELRSGFYLRTLAAAGAASAVVRVLVSGAADYAMLALVLAAMRGAGRAPAVTVMDLCDTPLMLNRWYADRAGCAIVTQQCDILDYPPGAPFDVVCTDSFIGRFAPAQRPALFAKWRTLLRPGGVIITQTRLRPGGGAERVGFSAEQAQNLRDNALHAAKRLGDKLGVEPEELARCAAVYAAHHFTYPVRAADEIRAQLEPAGFRTDVLATATVGADVSGAASGPSTRAGGEFLDIVARAV